MTPSVQPWRRGDRGASERRGRARGGLGDARSCRRLLDRGRARRAAAPPRRPRAPAARSLTAPPVQHDRAVADQLDLGQLAGEQQHRGARRRRARAAARRSGAWCRRRCRASGRSSSITSKPAASQRAIVSFCWLPPREPARLALRRACRSAAGRRRRRTRRRSSARVDRPPARDAVVQRRARCSRGSSRCGSSASRRSAGTSTTPARIASYGVARPAAACPSTHDLAVARLALAGEAGRRARPGPGPRARRRRAISPGAHLEARRSSGGAVDGEAADLERGAGRPRRRRRRRRAAAVAASTSATAAAARRASARRSAPPRPGRGTSVPTARPSRSTVARSQSARDLGEAVGDEQHRAAARRASSRTTANTRSARSDGSAAVISSSSSSCGS